MELVERFSQILVKEQKEIRVGVRCVRFASKIGVGIRVGVGAWIGV